MLKELVIVLKPLDTAGSQVRLGLAELSYQTELQTPLVTTNVPTSFLSLSESASDLEPPYGIEP